MYKFLTKSLFILQIYIPLQEFDLVFKKHFKKTGKVIKRSNCY